MIETSLPPCDLSYTLTLSYHPSLEQLRFTPDLSPIELCLGRHLKCPGSFQLSRKPPPLIIVSIDAPIEPLPVHSNARSVQREEIMTNDFHFLFFFFYCFKI